MPTGRCLLRLAPIYSTILWTLVPVSGSAGQAGGPGSEAGACPDDHPLLRQFVEHIIEAPAKAPDREELGLVDVADQPLRVLGDRTADYPVCAQLYRQVPRAYRVRGKDSPDTVVFYRIADRYLMALSSLPARQGESTSGPDQFVSFDLDLNEIGGMVY